MLLHAVKVLPKELFGTHILDWILRGRLYSHEPSIGQSQHGAAQLNKPFQKRISVGLTALLRNTEWFVEKRCHASFRAGFSIWPSRVFCFWVDKKRRLTR